MRTQSTVFQIRRPLEWDYEDYLDYDECETCGKHFPEDELELVRGHLICHDCTEQAYIDARRARYE